MKRKYFLRGLGIGIIVTALLLCIAYRKQMTEQNIINQAKSFGMVFPETSETPQAEPTVEPTATAAPTSTAAPTPEKTAAPSPEVAATPSPEVTKKPSKKNVRIKVSSGMDSSSVSKKIEKAGLVKSSKDFDRYLVKKGYADNISVGNYEIPSGASYQEIAKIITK